MLLSTIGYYIALKVTLKDKKRIKMSLISAQKISHSFENLLYSDLDLEIESKQSVAILGVSGSGKSSIINNLSTLLKPKSGKVSLLGIEDIYSLSAKNLLALRRFDIGIVFQSHYLFRGFNGLENLKVASILSKQEIDENLLREFDILHTIRQQIGELSGGQQQRLSIARVLTKKPKIIFADEPTGNLDKNMAHKVMDITLSYINQNSGALLLATHDKDIANKCDKIYHLYEKQLHRIK